MAEFSRLSHLANLRDAAKAIEHRQMICHHKLHTHLEMKTISINFSKKDKQATCMLRYWEARWPIGECEWSGDVEEFLLEDGCLLDPSCPLDELARYVALQAARVEADFTIEDDGGEMRQRRHGGLVSDGGGVDVYTATFRKGEHRAACELRYWGGASQPMRNEWTGDEEAYRLPDGSLFKFRFPQETLEGELASQAERIGAEFSMTHRIITLE